MRAPEVTLAAQPSYPAGGPVPVKVVVANVSAEPLLVNARLLVTVGAGEGDLAFDVEGAGGQGYEYRAFVTPDELEEKDFVVLEPGASIERTVDLARDYSVTAAGAYRAVVTYRSAKDFTKSGLKAWTGVARSQPATVELK
jgi:hypothetical protein